MDKNKKKDLIWAYIVEIPIMLILMYVNALNWVILATLILFPVMMIAITRKKPLIQMTDMSSMPVTGSLLIMLGMFICFASGYWAGKTDYRDANKSEICQEEKCLDNNILNDLYRKAKIYYKNNDYDKAIKYLEMAENFDPVYIVPITENVKQIKILDKEIRNNPNDYTQYIKRGDLKNIPEYILFADENHGITSDYYGAIKDYTKALKLNPSAYEVYEKRGDAWTEYGYKACLGCKLERTKDEDANAISDYESAIKYTGGNDRLFAKLGGIYMKSDPQKALHYFNMIKDQYPKRDKDKVMPYPDSAFGSFNFYNYAHVPTSKAICYGELKEYDNALTVVSEMLQNETDVNIIKQAKNMEFYYNWKAGHYRKALKNANDCSVWVCKILGLVF